MLVSHTGSRLGHHWQRGDVCIHTRKRRNREGWGAKVEQKTRDAVLKKVTQELKDGEEVAR